MFVVLSNETDKSTDGDQVTANGVKIQIRINTRLTGKRMK
jgi:hypothetical protein